MALPFLSVFDVLFAVFLALFPQATNLVLLNHMHSDEEGWGVGGGGGDEEDEKRRERVGGGVGGHMYYLHHRPHQLGLLQQR